MDGGRFPGNQRHRVRLGQHWLRGDQRISSTRATAAWVSIDDILVILCPGGLLLETQLANEALILLLLFPHLFLFFFQLFLLLLLLLDLALESYFSPFQFLKVRKNNNNKMYQSFPSNLSPINTPHQAVSVSSTKVE